MKPGFLEVPFSETGEGAGMSTVMAANAAGNVGEISLKLEFTKNLNHVVNKIHATSNIDEIMLMSARTSARCSMPTG
jgi:hypothetical protein